MPRRFLVTGGAGFVGSHLVATLLDRGDACVVLDNLRTGHLGAVLPRARLITCDLADRVALDEALADGPWDAVFHFAAMSLVGESMREPYRYLAENIGSGIALIEACVRHGVRRFVLSSTAALFGAPEQMPIGENAPITPGSPYGESKWVLERALMWADRIHGLRSACLRYFNAAGADPAGRLGEAHDPETHLIPLVIDAALGRRAALDIFGTDYATHDGTCIRDYIHVTDLAAAHVAALRHLEAGGASAALNLGTGAGLSVRAILTAVERVAGRAVPAEMAPRRAGDPPELVADPTRARQLLGWTPRCSDIESVIATAYRWAARQHNRQAP